MTIVGFIGMMVVLIAGHALLGAWRWLVADHSRERRK